MRKILATNIPSIMKKNKNVLLADMRSPVSFRDGHLEGAVNLPLKNFTNKIMPMPKNTVIVAYSDRYHDIDLVQGVKYAEQLGFSDIYIAEYKWLVTPIKYYNRTYSLKSTAITG